MLVFSLHISGHVRRIKSFSKLSLGQYLINIINLIPSSSEDSPYSSDLVNLHMIISVIYIIYNIYMHILQVPT